MHSGENIQRVTSLNSENILSQLKYTNNAILAEASRVSRLSLDTKNPEFPSKRKLGLTDKAYVAIHEYTDILSANEAKILSIQGL
mmetsp:Transcript_5854/g.8249  ORF Transcript_5854/g.8249 Transcript_5854/m.8249 type:complete len:85 (-) Transcript_5854:254-508(-)